jgi:hypothetical protein
LKLDSSDDSLYFRRDTFLVSTLCFNLDGIPFLATGLLGGGLSTSSSESEFDDSEFQVIDLQAGLKRLSKIHTLQHTIICTHALV